MLRYRFFQTVSSLGHDPICFRCVLLYNENDKWVPLLNKGLCQMTYFQGSLEITIDIFLDVIYTMFQNMDIA